MAKGICSVPICTKRVNARGLCSGHFSRLQRTGDVQPDVPLKPQVARAGREYTCITAGCASRTGVPGTARDMCSKCYNRWRKYGDVTVVKKGSPGKGSQHHSWKGDGAGYAALHNRVYRTRGKADHCDQCGASGTGARYEWAREHGTDGTNVNDYVPLCVPCHRTYDLARVTLEQRQEIRDRAAAGESPRALAREFGISPSVIRHGLDPRTRKWSSPR